MNIVMFVYDDVTHDTRVRREARALADDGHDVTIVGRPADLLDTVPNEADLDGVRVIRIPIPHRWRRAWRIGGAPIRAAARLLARVRGRPGGGRTLAWLVIWRFATTGWAQRAAAAAPAAGVYHGHDLSGLLAAGAAAAAHPGSRTLYDSHELFLEAGTVATQPGWARRPLVRAEQRLARAAAAIVTVNEAIATEIARRYDVQPPTVVHNCPPRPVGTPDRGRLRAALQLGPDVPVVICHGALGPNRGIEQTADALLQPGLEKAHLVLLGKATPTSDAVAAMPGLRGRVHHLAPVPPEEVVAWIAGADVASMPIQPTSLNHRLSTPNKLFESLAAGVPVVSSAFPVRRAIVCDDPAGSLGAVCDPEQPTAVAAAIRSILDLPPDERTALRDRCLEAARSRWNWETEAGHLVALYRRLGDAS
jgi:glycosyltransferase involved in cell wall biosynthesis